MARLLQGSNWSYQIMRFSPRSPFPFCFHSIFLFRDVKPRKSHSHSPQPIKLRHTAVASSAVMEVIRTRNHSIRKEIHLARTWANEGFFKKSLADRPARKKQTKQRWHNLQLNLTKIIKSSRSNQSSNTTSPDWIIGLEKNSNAISCVIQFARCVAEPSRETLWQRRRVRTRRQSK